MTTPEEAKTVMSHLHDRFFNEKMIFSKRAREPEDFKNSHSILTSVDISGFNFVCVPYSPKFNENSRYHRCHVVRFIVPAGHSLIFKARLLHAGGRSRLDEDGITVLEDKRLFAYVNTGQTSREPKFLPELNSNLFWPVSTTQCYNMDHNKNNCNPCDYCRSSFIFDRTESLAIDLNMFVNEDAPPGTIIFGSLESEGFSVFKSPTMSSAVGNRIDELRSKLISNAGGIRNQPNRKMLLSKGATDLAYTLVVTDTRLGGGKNNLGVLNEYWGKLIVLVKTFFGTSERVFFKHNILWNSGTITYDQQMHFDYQVLNVEPDDL